MATAGKIAHIYLHIYKGEPDDSDGTGWNKVELWDHDGLDKLIEHEWRIHLEKGDVIGKSEWPEIMATLLKISTQKIPSRGPGI